MGIKRLLRNKKGAALMYTMMFLLLLSVIVVSFSLISINMYKNTAVSANKTQSFMFAKAIGQAFALELTDELDANSIVSYLEQNTKYASTVKGNATVKFDPNDESKKSQITNAIRGTGVSIEDLTAINLTAGLKFYFKTTCAYCGSSLEDLVDDRGNPTEYCQSNVCKNLYRSEKNTNKRYLYLDVTVSYHGATEVVTTVFTYLDNEDFVQTMHDLFSIYNIYSTYPSEMTFNFATPTDLGNGVQPNVYLYNGIDSESDGYGSISSDTYKLTTDIKANLTSTGDVTVRSDSATIKNIYGRLTSYGSMSLAYLNVQDVFIRNNLTVNSTAKVNGTIYSRGKVSVTGSTSDPNKTMVNGTIYALGDVTIRDCVVGKIVGGGGCNVTLINATCDSISTGGKVTLTNSNVKGDIYCDGNLTISNSKSADSYVGGKIETKGDLTVTKSQGSGYLTLGKNSSGVLLHVGGNASFTSVTSSGIGQIVIAGSACIEGGIKYTKSRNQTVIKGNLEVKGGISQTIGGVDVKACYLSSLLVEGDVLLSSYDCTPLFGNLNGLSTGAKTQIKGLLTTYGSFRVGETVQGVLGSEKGLGSGYTFTDGKSRFVNLNGATISRIYVAAAGLSDTTQLFIQNGEITDSIEAMQVVVSGLTLSENSKVNAIGNQGCFIAVDRSKLYGQVVATQLFSLHQGSILYATDNGFVHVSGDNSSGSKPTAIVNGEIYGELVVGRSAVKGEIIIKEKALLGGNTLDKAIYVTGDLTVESHSASAITNRPEQYAPRLRTDSNNGNRIYVNEGRAYLQGWVYDLYIKNGEVEMGDERVGCAKKPYIKGTTYIESDYIFIGKDGLEDSEGATYTNTNVIVYIYETPTNELGDLTISGTLVVRQGVTLKCKSLKVNRIISDYNGAIVNANNKETVKTALDNLVNTYNFNADSVAKNFIISGDTQINQIANSILTFDNCEFKGWLKVKNVSGKVVFNNSAVTGTVKTSYSNNDSDNYKGCLDVSSANLDMNNSYVGGTQYNNNVTSGSAYYEGNVYCGKLFTMNGGQVYGTVYCEYADKLKNCKINGGLIMSASTVKTANDWSPTFIDNVIYGKYVKVKMSKGVLGSTSYTGSVGSNNLNTNSRFVYLNDLTMTSEAVVAQYVSVFIENGSDTRLSGKNIGNVYAKTSKLTFTLSSSVNETSVAGYVNCTGVLSYANNVTLSAGKGLFANNRSEKLTESTSAFNNIDGNVDLPNYTQSITLSKVSGYVYSPSATVNAKNTISKNVEVKVLNVMPAVDMSFNSTVLATQGLYVDTSKTVNFYGVVKTSLLVCNTKLSSGANITLSTLINDPASTFTLTSSTSRNIVFNACVYVNDYSGNGGRAFLGNCKFNSKSSSYTGATLFADRGVLAKYCDFYSAGYTSTTQHAFASSLNAYNTTQGNIATRFGSINAGLKGSDSSAYGLYLLNSSVYSNIALQTTNSAYIQGCSLGIALNADYQSNLNLTNYTKQYYFKGDLSLNSTSISSVTSTAKSDPIGYTIVNVAKSLVLSNGSTIGSSYSTARIHAHTGFKGVYVGSNMTIGANCTVRLNIYCKGTLSNSGNIELNVKETINWSDTKGWGWTSDTQYMSSTYSCGGVIYATTFNDYGACSMKFQPTGWNMDKSAKWQKFEQKDGDGHNTKAGVIDKPTREKDYSRCKHNENHIYTSGVPSQTSYMTTTTPALASVFISTAFSRSSFSTYLPYVASLNGFSGLEWDSTESMEGRKKTPRSYLSVNNVTKVNQINGDIVNKTNVNVYYMNPDTWYPQAIPLRWYLPTETTAGEKVSLTGRGSGSNYDNYLTISEKNLGESIDSLEKCIQNFKEFGDLSFWDWVKGDAIRIGKDLIKNAGNFFTNLPTLFTPSSRYVGLKFKTNDDAKYYRVSASNIDNVKRDLAGRDMLIITRRTIVANSFFPSGDLLDALVKYVNWNRNWVIPTSVSINKRPVGLVFFNSGIVPSSVFDTTYRKASDWSKEVDENGRYIWGGGGNWFSNLSPVNDVTWTFFTCEDPANPYTSAPKDLHIIIPANTKMIWEKDKDSCLNIIGNGRVFLYLQDNTDIKIVGNGFTHWLHDDITGSIDNWLSQWAGKDATYNVFGGVRYVRTEGSGLDEKTYYDSNGYPVMDAKAVSSGQYQLQPRLFIVGTGGNIRLEVQDFQTSAYVYMPSGYSYGNTDARNTFMISSNQNAQGDNNWDVYGMYVCDNFMYLNNTSAKVNYVKTSPDLSNTAFKYTNTSNWRTTVALKDNKSYYQLAEFWDYPVDLPVSSMNWYYRGLALS